jgi:hypothetical protein
MGGFVLGTAVTGEESLAGADAVEQSATGGS